MCVIYIYTYTIHILYIYTYISMHVNSSGMSDEPLAGISMGFTMTSPRHKRTVTGAFPSETTSCSRETTIYIYTGWWFQTCFIVHDIYGIILPIDYFSRWLKPPTSIYTHVFISYVLICLFVDVHSGWWIDFVWFCPEFSLVERKRGDSQFWTTNKSTYANGTSNWLFLFFPREHDWWYQRGFQNFSREGRLSRTSLGSWKFLFFLEKQCFATLVLTSRAPTRSVSFSAKVAAFSAITRGGRHILAKGSTWKNFTRKMT